MKKRVDLQNLRRRNARLLAIASKGMQATAEDVGMPESAIQAVVSFRGFETNRNDEQEIEGLTLTGCSIDTVGGDTVAADAVLRIGGQAARQLARDPKCLQAHAFTIRCAVVPHDADRATFDMIAFAGTSPAGRNHAA